MMLRNIAVVIGAALLLAGTTTQAQAQVQAQIEQPGDFEAAHQEAYARYTEGLKQDSREILQESVTMWTERVLPLVPRNRNPAMWAVTQINLGNALWALGERTSGDEGLDLLVRAVRAREATLEVATREMATVWAMTQNNLGISLQSLGKRTEGQAGLDLLARAVSAYEAALTVHTRNATIPEWAGSWAKTQSNLGSALANQGERAGGEDGRQLFARAIKAHEAALEVLTPDETPVEWARTQHNLGISLAELGERTNGGDGQALLARAVQTLEATVAASPREAGPIPWAQTQKNLGTARQSLGSRSEGPDRRRLWQQAATAYAEALTVFTADARPSDHEVTTGKLAAVQALLAAAE